MASIVVSSSVATSIAFAASTALVDGLRRLCGTQRRQRKDDRGGQEARPQQGDGVRRGRGQWSYRATPARGPTSRCGRPSRASGPSTRPKRAGPARRAVVRSPRHRHAAAPHRHTPVRSRGTVAATRPRRGDGTSRRRTRPAPRPAQSSRGGVRVRARGGTPAAVRAHPTRARRSAGARPDDARPTSPARRSHRAAGPRQGVFRPLSRAIACSVACP